MADQPEAMDDAGPGDVTGEAAAVSASPPDSVPAVPAEAGQAVPAELQTIIGELTATLARRDEDAAAHDLESRAALAERDGEIAGLQAAAAEREQQINALQEELRCAAGLRTTIAELTATLACRFEETAALRLQLRTALAERDGEVAGLQTAVAERDQRIKALQAEQLRATDLQRSLEAEFDLSRRQHGQAGSALATLRDEMAALRRELAARDAVIANLQAEAARRGPPGSPAAVGTALADLLRTARQRRLERLAATQPWRLPPAPRR